MHEVNKRAEDAVAPAPEKDVFRYMEAIQQVTSLIINTKAAKGTDMVKIADPQRVKEQSQLQADRSKETKEQSQVQAERSIEKNG